MNYKSEEDKRTLIHHLIWKKTVQVQYSPILKLGATVVAQVKSRGNTMYTGNATPRHTSPSPIWMFWISEAEIQYKNAYVLGVILLILHYKYFRGWWNAIDSSQLCQARTLIGNTKVAYFLVEFGGISGHLIQVTSIPIKSARNDKSTSVHTVIKTGKKNCIFAIIIF